MTLIAYCTTFAASFAYIFLRAFQQRNVAFDHYWWIIPTSLGMAATEIYVLVNIAQHGYGLGLVFAVGLGSGTGALLAAIFHKWVMRRVDVVRFMLDPSKRKAEMSEQDIRAVADDPTAPRETD